MARRKRKGDKIHPYLTPVWTLKLLSADHFTLEILIQHPDDVDNLHRKTITSKAFS